MLRYLNFLALVSGNMNLTHAEEPLRWAGSPT
jgi:hypothetical protein